MGGFPQLFKQIPTDGQGTFLLESGCSFSQLPVSFTTDLTTSAFLSPSFPQNYLGTPGTSGVSIPEHLKQPLEGQTENCKVFPNLIVIISAF